MHILVLRLKILEMGITPFLQSVSRIPKRYYLCSSLQLFHIRSNAKIKYNNPTTYIEPHHSSLSNFQFTFCRSLHSSNSIEANDSNPPTNKILEDAGKICGLLSGNSSSGVEALLNKASIQVSPPLVFEVIKRLSNAGFLAFSFFKWAEKQKGFTYSAESYNVLIESLGKIKQFNLVWNLVTDMKQKKLLTKETFLLISRRYARSRRVKEAIDTFEKMEKFGLKIESSDFNRLIDTLSKSRQVQSAQEVFDKMKTRRFKPDVKSYTILLEGWGQEKNFLKLDEIHREMKAEGLEPDVVTYGILINAYCKAKKYDYAIQLYREMELNNCEPNPHIFCTLINALGSANRLKEALEFFNRSKALGFDPEIPTYNAVVGAYCWSMKMDDAFRVVDEMKKCGVGPNSRTYDIILHHLVKARKTTEAFSVFQKMKGEKGCEPTLSTYEIVIRMFCNIDQVDKAIEIWDQMKAKGILPGMHMFATLISSLCHENKLDLACKYFEEMLDVGIRPPGNLFSNLKQALIDGGKKETAVLLTKRISELRKTPYLV